MGLRQDLLRGIYGYGFENPSVIQQKAIVPLAKGLDIIAQSQSGTGKTGSFTIGLLQRINPQDNKLQALIMEPTRELAGQSADAVMSIGAYMDVVVHLAVGGNSIGRDAEKLRKGAHVVVGTPGRVEDLIRRGLLDLSDVKVVVLDEADEMLSQGFQDVVREILVALPKDTQVGLFSATLPPWTLELAGRFMHSPVNITIPQDDVSLDGIRQYYVDVEREENKLVTLVDLYEFLQVSQSVIFVNTRRSATKLADELTAQHFAVAVMHSSLSPEERKDVMSKFRGGRARVLIATDLLARGIDVQGVGVVINYDVTVNFENYIHRIGRCGRFGRKGLAINFITGKEHRLLRELQAYYSIEIPELPSNFSQDV